MSIVIRAATREDAQAISRLSDALGYSASIDDSVSALVELSADPDHAVRVAARGIPYVPLVLPADLGVEG